MKLKTEVQVRAAFWKAHPQFRYVPGRTQNDYHVDIRCAFVEYVDYLEREGIIDEELAQVVTL